MNNKNFIALYILLGFLVSERYGFFLRKVLRYKTFLEKTKPFVSKDRRSLKPETPERIKKGYEKYKQIIREEFLTTTEVLQKLGMDKKFFCTLCNDPELCGIGQTGKLLVNILSNFDSDEFNETLEQRMNELEGMVYTSKRLKENINIEISR